MAQHVRILDFLHELRTAGVGVDYAALIQTPEDFWSRLPADRQALILSRLKVEAQSGEPLGIKIVKRRGRDSSLDRIYVEIQPQQAAPPGPFRRARELLIYRPLAAPSSVGSPEEAAAVAELDLSGLFLRPDADPTPHGDLLAILDAAWGEEPYDLTTEGAFCGSFLVDGSTEIDRYHVEKPFSLVSIVRDADNRVTYTVVEPQLTELEKTLAATISERLRDLIIRDIDPSEDNSAQHLAQIVFDLIRIYRFDIDRRTAYRLGYYFIRSYLGFGRLEVLMRDPNIEDISCNGPNLPVYVVHSKHQNVCTDLVFDELELNSFTIKLAQRGGKLLSIAQPLVDATLPGGSRIQASLGREITSRGSAFTIRKFREDPLTCVDLIRTGTHSFESMAFLWLMAEMRRNLVVMGSTASGKTTTLNCLSQFIPPTVKVVTIEDTREITLQHENWLAAVTRDAFSGAESEKISMYDLLRAALRQRPEYIIVGEIRGVEGLTLFQAMSTGHTCFSTMHAGSVENAVYRLENQPIGVPRVMLTSLDFLLLQGQVELEGRHVRRMISLTELNGVDSTTRNLRTNDVFRWNPTTDVIDPVATSYVLDQTRSRRGWSRAQLQEELDARKVVLEGLVGAKKRHYTDVATAVRQFYDERAVQV